MSQAREGREKKWKGKARKTPMRVEKVQKIDVVGLDFPRVFISCTTHIKGC